MATLAPSRPHPPCLIPVCPRCRPASALHRADCRLRRCRCQVLGAGAVPVLIADGLSLPYEQLVDWAAAVVWVGEEELDSMGSYTQLLEAIEARLPPVQLQQPVLLASTAVSGTVPSPSPTPPPLTLTQAQAVESAGESDERVLAMRARVRRINAAFFATEALREQALVESARALVRARLQGAG
jgi:hypothetical protein